MKIENHILDILQLYEYSMSIGKSLDYQQNCNDFLKLLLKRVNFNACWIIKKNNTSYISQYSIPQGNTINTKINKEITNFSSGIGQCKLFQFNEVPKSLCPIKISEGYILIYSLYEEGFLFLYSKNHKFDHTLLPQLFPVIIKFSKVLKASRVFSDQQLLLDKLKESNEELNDYAHVVSHDLKSPIRNIETLISWIEEEFSGSINTHTSAYIRQIRQNITKMECLISSILTYSSIGSKEYQYQHIDLNYLLEDILEHNYIPDHFEVSFQKNLPTIMGDEFRLQQLFQNLINNAIKYNDKSKGLILIDYKELNEYHQFQIKDNGIGIAEDYHYKIFDTFQKLDNSIESSGVGLSIVKKIVNSYRGDVWLESELGVGTSFFFTLKKT